MAVWHEDPALKDRFHPDFPDDVQVLFHDGSFRFTNVHPEGMWVSIKKMKEFVLDDESVYRVYEGVLLNQPHNLKSVKVNDTVMFVAHENYDIPIFVTQAYLNDRLNYRIIPCNKCGLPEAFDPIEKLWKHSFKDAEMPKDVEAGMKMFTSICPSCGGMMVIGDRNIDDPTHEQLPILPASNRKSSMTNSIQPTSSQPTQSIATKSSWWSRIMSWFTGG